MVAEAEDTKPKLVASIFTSSALYHTVSIQKSINQRFFNNIVVVEVKSIKKLIITIIILISSIKSNSILKLFTT